MKILVVDDDRGTLNALKAYLTSAGHSVVVFSNAKDAFETLASHSRKMTPVDLVITDLKMPGMDGLELIRAVRWEARQELPAILVTAYGSDRIREEIMSIGRCGYLEKPISLEKLTEMIEQVHHGIR